MQGVAAIIVAIQKERQAYLGRAFLFFSPVLDVSSVAGIIGFEGFSFSKEILIFIVLFLYERLKKQD